MAGRHQKGRPGKGLKKACVMAPSHPVAVAAQSSSTCHVDAFAKPPTGWTKATRNLFYFASLILVGSELMTVLNVSEAVDSNGGSACRVVVARNASAARRHPQGAHASVPTLSRCQSKL